MASDRDRLQSLVDALPDTEVQVAISFLAELGEQEIIDVETAAKLDLARTEPGDDVPLEEVRRGLDINDFLLSQFRKKRNGHLHLSVRKGIHERLKAIAVGGHASIIASRATSQFRARISQLTDRKS